MNVSYKDEAIKQTGLADGYAKSGNCDAANNAAIACFNAKNNAETTYGEMTDIPDIDFMGTIINDAQAVTFICSDTYKDARTAANGCVPKPKVDYVKLAQDAQKRAEAARDEAVNQQKLAEADAKAGNCEAAKQAVAAAEAAANAAATAKIAAESAALNKEASSEARTASMSAYTAATNALAAAMTARNAARKAADGCVPKPKVDYAKQAQDAQKRAEAARDEAVNQQKLAEADAKAGNCEAAKQAAAAAKAAYAAAEAAYDAAESAAFTTYPSEEARTASKSALNAADIARGGASGAMVAARTAAKNCVQKTPPAPEPVISKPGMDFILGFALAAAQSSASTGYCSKEDGLGKAPENSTIAPSMNVGMQFSKNISGGGITSLDSPRSPYASFASYRPSAKGNAGPAPVTTAQGGQLNLMSLNLGVSYLHLEGKDRHPERNASFDKKMVEVLATGDFYVLNLLRAKSATKAPKLSPFLRLGAGFGIGDPNTVNGNMDTKKANFALPMGLGFRVDVSDLVSLNFDYTTRATFGDGLDGIKSSTGKKDWYGASGMGLNFKIGKGDNDRDGFTDHVDQCPYIPGTQNGCPDMDGDGIADKEDTCPRESGEKRLNGCPDRDGDGVADNRDDCPDASGLRRFSGCPDTDGDNVIDKEDDCPSVAGLPAMNGCPDADRDGITDKEDQCPNEPGTAEQKGCPDFDNDGIADKKDDCPNVAGPARFNGCPDSDNDGVPDPRDKCPALRGPASNQGCPEIDPIDKAVLDKAMGSVKFRRGSAELLPSSKQVLNQIAELMTRYKGYRLSIDGYTDNTGFASTNQSLSEARAKACYDYLSSAGVRLSFMTWAGHGPTNPVSDNNTEEGRIKNRRVEFNLLPQ